MSTDPAPDPHGTEGDTDAPDQPQEKPEQETPPEQEGTDWKAEARKWQDRAKENKAAADRLAEIEEAAKSDLERANDRAEKAERALAAKEHEALRLTVAARHGIPGDHLDLIQGDTEEDLDTKAQKVAALIAKETDRPAVGPYVPAEGTATSGSRETTADQFAAAVEHALHS